MRWLTSDPVLSFALTVVLGWFVGASITLYRKGRSLHANLTAFTGAIARAPSGRDDAALDAAVPRDCELPVVWRRIKASRFNAINGRLVLDSDPADLVTFEDLLEPTMWYRFCSAAPNYLVGLGLGFTFLGLVLALGAIDAQHLDDPAQLTRLFAAMKFKFIASMSGIFLSIVFSLFLRGYLSSLQHRFADFQAALATRYPVVDPVVNAVARLSERVEAVETGVRGSHALAARTADATERSLTIWGNVVDQLSTAATQLKQFNDELSISIGNVLEQRFEQKLLPPLNDALKSLERAVHGVREAHSSADNQMLTGVIHSFREAVSGGTSAEVAAITTTLARLNESLAATKDDLQGVGKTIEASIVEGLRCLFVEPRHA